MATAEDAGKGFRLDDKSFNRGGFYIGVGGATGWGTRFADELQRQIFLDTSTLVPVDGVSSTGFNGRIGGGGRWVSGEVQFEYLPSLGVRSPAVPTPGELFEYSVFVMTTNVKVTVPAGRFEPYFVFGAGLSRAKIETIPVGFLFDPTLDIALRTGGGLNFYLTRNIALTADATYVWTGAVDNQQLDYVSVSYGLLFKF